MKAQNHGACWTLAEISYLKTHYRHQPVADIAAYLGRTIKAVKGRAARLGCANKKARPWSEYEKAILLQNYNSRTQMRDIVAMLPGRKKTAIMAMAARLGLSHRENLWSRDETACLKLYYFAEGQMVLSRLPFKSDEAIRIKARELGLVSPGHTVARLWDKQEWERIARYQHLSVPELMTYFPERSLSSVKNALTRFRKARESGVIPTPQTSSQSVITAWNNEEKAVLARWYTSGKSMEDILAMLPGRHRSSVFSMARKMGLSRTYNPWTGEELQILREYYPTEGISVARRLSGRKTGTISMKAFQLGLRRIDGPFRSPWTEEELARLEKHKHLPSRKLQQLFPERSRSSLKNALTRAKARHKG